MNWVYKGNARILKIQLIIFSIVSIIPRWAWTQMDDAFIQFKINAISENKTDSFHQPFKITFSDSWVSKDKADHFLSSTFLAVGSYYVLQQENKVASSKSMTFSATFTFILGLGKEIYDGFKTGNAASIKDVAADVLGIGMGIVMFNLMDEK